MVPNIRKKLINGFHLTISGLLYFLVFNYDIIANLFYSANAALTFSAVGIDGIAPICWTVKLEARWA